MVSLTVAVMQFEAQGASHTRFILNFPFESVAGGGEGGRAQAGVRRVKGFDPNH